MRTDDIPAGDPDEIAARLVDTFESRFGRAPIGCFAAPGRVNLIGEHLDYNDGLCLPMALPHATYAALDARPDTAVTITSMQEEGTWEGDVAKLGPGDVEGWPTYVAGVVWALQQDGIEVPGLDILVDSRVPVGAGLSSSAALECSVALGVCAVAGVEVDDGIRRRLILACMRAEAEVAGAPTGGMDQTIALLGRAESALLLDCRDGSTEQVPWNPAAHGLELLVVDTRAEHSLNDGGYAARRSDCEEAARRLGVGSLREVENTDEALDQLADGEPDGERLHRRVRHVFTEMARIRHVVQLLRSEDYGSLGEAFTASHASLRDDYEVSAPELDAVVDTALASGAVGARMTGGGFGGSAIALVPADSVDEVSEAVATRFADSGWPAPGFLLARPSAGARQVS
jgi:galactokinase